MRSPFRNLVPNSLVCLALLAATTSKANNVQITNASLVNNNGSGGYCFIQFDISWQNSWRGGGVTNWDAAWVFAKFRTSNGVWRPLRVDFTGHVAASGSQLDAGLLNPASAYDAVTNPVMGEFIHRSADGTGTFTATGTQLRWTYLNDGLGFNDIAEVRVFAIEMAYVMPGAFAAGTGGVEAAGFTLTTISTATATSAPTGSGTLGGQAGGFPTGGTAPTTANWPNGFNGFYCMKYEVTQQGYVDFLNTLTFAQLTQRTATQGQLAGTGALTSTNANRNGIDIQVPGVDGITTSVFACNLNGNTTYGEAGDGKDIACNWMSWADLSAYLDWSGLRPMTELEFEKACRGTLQPVFFEFPWGVYGAASAAYTLSNSGTTNEGIATNYSTTAGNASWSSTTNALGGPTRVGINAANAANTGRVTAGASYYGIMDMGGNVWERAVTIGNAAGRSFSGAHGNGALAINGDPDVATWPSPTTADGIGFRGGTWAADYPLMCVSVRTNATTGLPERNYDYGGRGVRTAP